MKYRADIDGLRSFAILPIVLFHMGFAKLAGGFVGVDVFFVISGFLITQSINRDLQQGSFSLAGFYMRRVRRLFPALAVTLLGSIFAGYLLLSKTHFQETAGSAYAALLSWSNIYFWNRTDYFDSDAILKPLLHTWSLAVEEQFYLVWPAALMLMHNYARRWLLVFFVIAGAASLVAAQVMLTQDASAVFFLMPFRVCEFAIGSACALLPRLNVHIRVRDAMSILGLAGIVLVSFAYSERTVFPGINSMWPCLATASVIVASPEAAGNRIIALNPFRYIGRISYSLYLVHWPIVVFYAYYNDMPRSIWMASTLTTVAIASGALLYHAVEIPTRAKRQNRYLIDSRVFVGTASALATASMILFFAGWSGWIERKIPPQLERLSEQLVAGKADNKAFTRFETCHASAKSEEQYLQDWQLCYDKKGKFNLAIVGDSHAADLWGAINLVYPELKSLQFTGGGCGWATHAKPTSNCVYLRRHIKDWFAKNAGKVNAIIYTQRGRHFVFERPEDLRPMKFDRKNIRTLRKRLEMFQAETGVPVIFWGPRPELHPGPDLQLARSADMDELKGRLRKVRWKAYVLIDAELKKEFLNSSVKYVSVTDTLCQPAGCNYLTDDGKFVSYDPAHWTREGAMYILRKVVDTQPELKALFSAP